MENGEIPSNFDDFSPEQVYLNREPTTYRDIVLRAIEKCRTEGSKEMTKGKEVPIFNSQINQWVMHTVPDQRKIFIETIKMLSDLMIMHFDDKMTKFYDGILDGKDKKGGWEDQLLSSDAEFHKLYLEKEYDPEFKALAEATNAFPEGSKTAAAFQEALMDYKCNLYRQLYQQLLLLFKRKNELSGKRVLSPYE